MCGNSPRVIVLDPDFEHDGGHNYVTNQILAAHLKRPVQVACPQTLPLAVKVDGAELHRCFPGNSYVRDAPPQGGLQRLVYHVVGLLQRRPSHLQQRSNYIAALREYFDNHQVSRDDAVVVHTGSTFLFDVLLAALESGAERQWPSLHLRQLRPLENLNSAETVHSRLRTASRFTDVFMYSETDAFAGELMRLGHDADDICKLELSDLRQIPEPASGPTDTFRLAVLGTVRHEKGHGRLAAIASAYRRLADKQSGPALKFMIHVGITKNKRLFDRMIRDLTASGAEFELIQHPRGVAGHWNCLASSHAVLVPYAPDRYTNRGSGICIDAIASAKPLIVSANCTLQEYIRGDNGMAAASDDDFAAAILEIARNYELYTGIATRQAAEFHTTQQSHPLFDRLASATRGRHDME